MVAAQPGGSGYAVEQRHVNVQNDRIGSELLGEFDCLEAVDRGRDHLELGLLVDQFAERTEEGAIVVGNQDADRVGGGVPRGIHGRQS